jgi:hypothetical protein
LPWAIFRLESRTRWKPSIPVRRPCASRASRRWWASGGEHALAPAVRAFRAELERRFMIPTECVNERYTSANAEGMLRDAGVRGRAQKQYLDQVAATTILDDYFANHDDTDA